MDTYGSFYHIAFFHLKIIQPNLVTIASQQAGWHRKTLFSLF